MIKRYEQNITDLRWNLLKKEDEEFEQEEENG